MTTIIDTIALTTTVTCFAITSVFPHIIIITTILITKSLLPLYCCIVVVVVDGLSAIGGGVFCYTHFIRSVSLISPIAKPALGRKPAGQFLLRSHTLVLGGKDISRSDSRKSLVDELSPKQLARVLRGLNACSVADAPLFEALRRRASQLSHVFFGTHAVSALVAFAEAEQVDIATDYIVVLTTVSRLPADMRLVSLPQSFVEELLQALRQRGYGDWRLDPEAIQGDAHGKAGGQAFCCADYCKVVAMSQEIPTSGI
eukprot:s1746_g9.t1